MVPGMLLLFRNPGSHLTSDALAVHTQISQHEDCVVLFNKNTFSRVEAQGVFVGQVHEYTDWALCGSCAQAWFRRASTGKRTDVQAQERGHQHLPRGLRSPRNCGVCGWQAIMGKCPFP